MVTSFSHVIVYVQQMYSIYIHGFKQKGINSRMCNGCKCMCRSFECIISKQFYSQCKHGGKLRIV